MKPSLGQLDQTQVTSPASSFDGGPAALPVDQVVEGDCIQVMNSLPAESIDLVFADPPYNLQLQQDLWRPNLTKVDAVDDDWDQFDSFAHYDEFTRHWLTACRRLLKPNGTLWVIGSYHNIYRVGTILQDLGFWFLNDLAWIKCLAGDTEVLALINGDPIVSTIKDLVRLDLHSNNIQLPSYDINGCSSWINLVASQINPKESGLRIELEDGNWVECTHGHRFPVARSGHIEYLRADQLTIEDTLLQLGRFHLPRVTESTGVDESVGEFIGWYLAEGSYLAESKGVTLSMSSTEKDAAEKLINTVRNKFGVVGRIHIYDSSLHLVFPGHFMIELVRRFIRGENAKTKRLTREAYFFGPEFLRGVLRGYLLGDGHWDSQSQRWRLGLARNKGLVMDLSVICRVLGFRLRFSEGFVPYRDAKAETIRGEIRENLDGSFDYASLGSLGLPTRRFFTEGQNYSLEYLRRSYKLVTRKNPTGKLTDLANLVLNGDLRPIRIKSIREGNHKTFYDLAMDGNHVFALANGLLTHNSNPMPNFRGVRFTNAHETLLWAQKQKGAPYTFNYRAMKALNDDLQMRSDWHLPICSGRERLKLNGQKAHPTQKPEALLYRVIFSSSNTGDLILDPFFGTGTTGVVAKRLQRHYIGIERSPVYVELSRQRLDDVRQLDFDPALFFTASPRREARIPFGTLLEYGLLEPGQTLYFEGRNEMTARILADGSLQCRGEHGSIHQIGRSLRQSPCNGWEAWFYRDPKTGGLESINTLRQVIRSASEASVASPASQEGTGVDPE